MTIEIDSHKGIRLSFCKVFFKNTLRRFLLIHYIDIKYFYII